MTITPINIKTQEFAKSLRGYDADEVKAFLEKIAVEVEDLMNENDTLKDEIEELNTSLDEYKKIEKDLQTTILNAQDSSAKSTEAVKKQFP